MGASLRIFGRAAYICVIMQKYEHLDQQDNHSIKALLMQAIKIAEKVGVHKSTISRQLSRSVSTRDRYANEYHPKAALQKTNRVIAPNAHISGTPRTSSKMLSGGCARKSTARS